MGRCTRYFLLACVLHSFNRLKRLWNKLVIRDVYQTFKYTIEYFFHKNIIFKRVFEPPYFVTINTKDSTCYEKEKNHYGEGIFCHFFIECKAFKRSICRRSILHLMPPHRVQKILFKYKPPRKDISLTMSRHWFSFQLLL